MNRQSASASLLALTLALGLSAAQAVNAQEADGDPPPAEASPAFQAPRGEGRRFDPPAGALPDVAPPPAPGEDRRPGAWGRYGQPREVPPPPAPPGARPEPDRGDRGDRDRRGERRRHDGYGAYETWGWSHDRDDDWRGRYDRYTPYTPYTPPPRRPPRYDPRGYPPVWTPPYRYRGDRWVPPPGFVPRRWSYGEVLPWTWWTPRYRIESWWAYGLPVPPVGYAWVRLGRDAALVDLWTGRVVQIAFSLFW